MARPKRSALPYITGEKGVNRVRLYAHAKTGILWLDCRTPERIRQSLGHRDIERGKQEAEKLAARLRSASTPREADVTLKSLFDNYEREVTPTKSAGVQEHDRRARKLFETCWGGGTKVKDLDRRDWDRFIQQRRSGQLRPARGRRKEAPPGRDREQRGVRDRQIEYDLKYVFAVLSWGETVRVNGKVLVERNPLRGFAIPSEVSPRRPHVTDDEYRALERTADEIGGLVPLYLALVYETGHRCMAVARLRWSDVDFAAGTVRWRGEHDKVGNEHTTPLPVRAVDALRAARRRTGTLEDGWVFPSPTDPSKPVRRDLVRDWWERLEKLAKLPRVNRRGWHSLRRKFATDLQDTAPRELMALGGWRNYQTVVKCYQQPREQAMRAALANRGQMLTAGEPKQAATGTLNGHTGE